MTSERESDGPNKPINNHPSLEEKLLVGTFCGSSAIKRQKEDKCQLCTNRRDGSLVRRVLYEKANTGNAYGDSFKTGDSFPHCTMHTGVASYYQLPRRHYFGKIIE